MQPIAQAVLRSWSIPPVATFALVLIALTYLRGTWLLRRAGYPNLPAWRVGSFLLGLFSLWFALASPLDTFGPFVLTAHMLQHMILMMVAPPLILLGESLIPIVRGMPRFAAREFAGPFLNWPIAERVGIALTNPVVALLLMGTAMFVWHVPGPYELAVRSSSWHQVEHACFFFASVIFWWPVVQPWPSRAQWPRWAMVPYLVIADLQNTVLSAVLVFSDKILYPSYAAGPSLFGFTPKEDQAAAGATMWVVGSLVFIVPAVLIAIQCLSRARPTLQSVEGHGFSRADGPTENRASALELAPLKLKAAASGLTGRKPRAFTSSRNLELASFLILLAVTASVFVVLSRFSTDNDDQVLRASQQAGPFAVAVYGPAGDISTGPATFGVLVQDRDRNEVLLDSQVDFALSNRIAEDGPLQQVRATRDTENKLLFSADLDFDSSGAQVLAIQVRRAGRSGTLSLPVEVMKSENGTSVRWSYIVILALVGILCAVYLLRHKTPGSARLAAPVT
jgi:putative membrane protein